MEPHYNCDDKNVQSYVSGKGHEYKEDEIEESGTTEELLITIQGMHVCDIESPVQPINKHLQQTKTL